MNRPRRILILIALGAALLAPATVDAAVRFGVGVNIGPYYGPYGYGPYYAPGYYYAPPPVVYAPPVVTIEQAPQAYWYFCRPLRAYYPYVRTCSEAWQAVPVQEKHAAANPAPSPAPRDKVTYSLGDVLFETGKAELRPAATATLDALIETARKDPSRRIAIEGFTDSTGNSQRNRELSQRRAESVRQYMEAHGIAADRMTATGEGDSKPVAGNDTAEGRQKNRRVNVTIG